MKDWKTTVIRTSLERLGYKMILPYLSLYIISLGATKSQLGFITSLGMLLAAFIGPPTGTIIDRSGPKKVYIFGIVLLLASYLIYAVAPAWQWCVLAMIIYYLGNGTSIHSCATICGNCLQNCDRAKGMLVCESLAAGLLGMIGPVLASFILVNIIHAPEQGAGAEHYRYLFYFSAFFTLISLLVVFKGISKDQKSTAKRSFKLKDGWDIVKTNKNARKWVFISALASLPTAMVTPYWTVFAQEQRGASVSMLAAMVTVSALTSVILGYSVGDIADRIGRKKVLYVLYPLFWLSSILLITTKANWLLIPVGIFYGFYEIASPLSSAVQRELVDNSVMGTWIGVTKLTNGIASAIMVFIAGILYDKVGPAWVFIVYIALDALIRLPLFITIPETLHQEKNGQ